MRSGFGPMAAVRIAQAKAYGADIKRCLIQGAHISWLLVAVRKIAVSVVVMDCLADKENKRSTYWEMTLSE